MADASYTAPDHLSPVERTPIQLGVGTTLGQSFTAAKPFIAVGGEFPTWGEHASGVTLTLRAGGAGGKEIVSRRFADLEDNAIGFLDLGTALPAGVYYLEMSQPVGRAGWWSYRANVYDGGEAYDMGSACGGDRSLSIRYTGDPKIARLSPDAWRISAEGAKAEALAMREFFTFRSPIAAYDISKPRPGDWAWLQNYPQAVQRGPEGGIEQITVGVAQNYNAATHLAPMSFPGAFGRSYHKGRMEAATGAVRFGYNFAEQWQRALEMNPPFVFVTGWNEWTAGFYDKWAGYTAPPPIFVDEFDQEFSRDIEPMRGGHGDNYYYQLVNNVRRYKGVRELQPVTPIPMELDDFGAWQKVAPEFRDAIGDEARRDAPGFGVTGSYVNTTGRNDIVAAKVSYDPQAVYFYVRTRQDLTKPSGANWMLLYLNVGADYKTGWLGYDFVVNRKVGAETTSLERNLGGEYQWAETAQVRYRASGKELVVAIPRSALGITRLPVVIDFKWADNCYAKGDWTDFILNGDAAPDDRFNYRAILAK